MRARDNNVITNSLNVITLHDEKLVLLGTPINELHFAISLSMIILSIILHV